MKKVRVYLWTLPRWFAAPCAICSVLLGGFIAEVSFIPLLLLVAVALCLMAWAHGMNTFLDFAWTHFDAGLETERSRVKEYTAGQSIIEMKIITTIESFLGSLAWLMLGGLLLWVSIAYLGTSLWAITIFLAIALCTFWYSWAKLKYHPEIPLGLGFGSFAAMLGASGISDPPLIIAFLAGIPFTIMWGFCAESYDQWVDWEPNWPRGLRNIGAWVGKAGYRIGIVFLALMLMSYISQMGLIAADILAPTTLLSLVAFPIFFYSALIVEKKKKAGVVIGLLAIFLHMTLFVVGQGI